MNFSIGEMIFLFLAALILVGPKKLPEIMRQAGKFMNEFRRASNEFKYQIESEVRNMELETERAKQTILPPANLKTPMGTVANGALAEGQLPAAANAAAPSPATPEPASVAASAATTFATSVATAESGPAALPAKSVDA